MWMDLCISTCRRKNLHPYLTPYTKTNSKQRLQYKILNHKTPRGNHRRKLDIDLGSDFLDITPNVLATKSKSEQGSQVIYRGPRVWHCSLLFSELSLRWNQNIRGSPKKTDGMTFVYRRHHTVRDMCLREEELLSPWNIECICIYMNSSGCVWHRMVNPLCCNIDTVLI